MARLRKRQPKQRQRRNKLRLRNNKEENNQVARLKIKTIREMNDGDVQGKLSEMKADLAKLKLERSKGTLKKNSANIRWLKRDIARMNTILNERKSKK